MTDLETQIPMKSLLLFFSFFSFLSSFSQDQIRITWTFENIQPGFDHNNKIIVYVDNQPVAESETFLESQKGVLVIPYNSNQFHKIRVMNYAWSDGEWEEHLITNRYSIDCKFEKNVKLKKDKTGDLIMSFDFKTNQMKTEKKFLKTKKLKFEKS